MADIEKDIVATIKASKSKLGKSKFVFDGFKHAKLDDFLKFTE